MRADAIGTLVSRYVGTAGTPDGPVHVLREPSGNEIGLVQQDCPYALVGSYGDPDHANAAH
jgi:hypothetical protein